MNDGHTVVAVDGLKIEPLPEALAGSTPSASGTRSSRSETSRGLRAARPPGHGRLRRRGRVRDHRPLEQELPQDHPPAAGAPGRVHDVRRRPVRRHHDRRWRLRHGLRPHRPLHGRRPADRHPDEERPGPRGPPGVRLPHGLAAHRRGEVGEPWPTCRSGCRSSSSAAASPPSTPRPSPWPITSCRSRSSSTATRN